MDWITPALIIALSLSAVGLLAHSLYWSGYDRGYRDMEQASEQEKSAERARQPWPMGDGQ